MTAAELRRLADRKVAEASSLSTAAERLRSESAALHGVLEPLIARSGRVWFGPAAAEFEANTRKRGRVLDHQADRLAEIANELELRARRLRSEAAVLRSQATSVASSHGAG